MDSTGLGTFMSPEIASGGFKDAPVLGCCRAEGMAEAQGFDEQQNGSSGQSDVGKQEEATTLSFAAWFSCVLRKACFKVVKL